MYPLAISVWKYHPNDNWFRDLVSRSITYFTGYEYTHVGIMIRGVHYDSTVWNDPVTGKLLTGIRRTWGFPPGRPDFCAVPDNSVPHEMMNQIERVCKKRYDGGHPYNVLKLVVLALVWPTRWIWRKIGWVPFDHEMHGEVCSGFVDEVFKASGWDLFPREYEGYTVPGQFVHIPGWHHVPNSEVVS